MDDLKVGIDRAVRIIKFDRATIAQVADDPAAFQIGLAIVAIGGLAHGVGGIRNSVAGLLMMPVLSVLGAFIGAGIFFLVGLLVKPPTWDFMRLFRATSHTSILNWAGVLTIIPILGIFISLALGIYQICVTVVTVEVVGNCDRGKALIIVLLPVAVCCVLVGAVAFIFGAAVLSALGLGALASSAN